MVESQPLDQLNGTEERRMSTLTIGIPTYRRPSCLQNRLHELVPQLGPATVLVVQDNASPDDYAAVVSRVRGNTSCNQFFYRRNPTNIGGIGNILKLIETCDTEWLWILGDDDVTVDGAVEKIHAAIRSTPQANYFDFSSRDTYKERIVTIGVKGLLRSPATFANLSFISSGVYRVQPLKENLRVGYDFASTGHSYLAMMLMGVGSDGVAVLLPERLTLGAEAPCSWSVLDVYLGFPLLGDMLGDEEGGRLLRAFVAKTLNQSWLFSNLWEAKDVRAGTAHRAEWFVRAMLRNPEAISSPLALLEFLGRASALRWPTAAGLPVDIGRRVARIVRKLRSQA